MELKSAIEEIISTIVVDGSPESQLSFFFGDEFEQNFEADNIQFPAVFLDTPIKSQFDIKQSGYIEESSNIVLLFLDLTDKDATPSQIDFVVREQKGYFKKFLIKIQNSDKIRFINRIEGEEVKNLFDANLSGYMGTLSLTPFDDTTLCE